MLVFTGTHINKIDRKGRVSVPAPFRTTLAEAGASGFAIFPSFNSKALEACTSDVMEALADDTIGSYSFFTPDHNNHATRIFEVTHQLAWDAEGRIGLPEELIAHAGIGETAIFVGKGRIFQVWGADAHAAHRIATDIKIAQDPPRLVLRRPEGS